MAKLLADVQDVSSVRQKLARERVTQVVKSDRTKLRLSKHPFEVARLHVLDVYEAPVPVSENIPGFHFSLSSVPPFALGDGSHSGFPTGRLTGLPFAFRFWSSRLQLHQSG